MKKYRVNNEVIAVRKNSLAHKFIEHGIPFVVIGTVLLVIAAGYGLSVMWAGILGGM